MNRTERLGDALRLLRESRGLSQRSVAEALGVEPSVVSGWERGRRQPSLKRFGQLADHLEIDLGDLDDALALTGRPAGRRGGDEEEVPLEPRRLARRLVGRGGRLPLDPSEGELARLLQALLNLVGRA